MTYSAKDGPLGGKIALVTGAGKGFGEAIAEKFLQNGASVVLHYRISAASCHRLSASAPDRTLVVQADVTDPDAGRFLVEQAMDRFGRIDILVNNAGKMSVGEFVESSEAQWEADIDVNLWGTLRVTHAVVPEMIKHRHGKIINVASQLALGGWDRGSVYAGTKGFILTWTKSLAAELGKFGINVNAIGPGSIVTDMNHDIYPDAEAERRVASELPLRRLGRPSDVAESALFLASGGSDFMTGQMLSPNGGKQM